MGKGLWGAIAALALAGCGGGPAASAKAPVDAGDPDAGWVAQSAPPPPAVTYSTDRGTLTSSEAFAIQSAQTELQAPVDGGASYVGFQLSDAAQCGPANRDGGASDDPGQVTHVLSGFVRTFDGTPVRPGLYPIGMSSNDQLQGYLQLDEFDRGSGNSRTLLATAGHLSIDALDGGHLEATIQVQLGDPAAQQELPLSGSFNSDSCSAP